MGRPWAFGRLYELDRPKTESALSGCAKEKSKSRANPRRLSDRREAAQRKALLFRNAAPSARYRQACRFSLCPILTKTAHRLKDEYRGHITLTDHIKSSRTSPFCYCVSCSVNMALSLIGRSFVIRGISPPQYSFVVYYLLVAARASILMVSIAAILALQITLRLFALSSPRWICLL